MNFWDAHPMGIFLIFFMLILPRTTFVLGALFGFLDISWTVLGVIGGVFIPRIVACIIATSVYWDTNPVLVVFAWIFAISATFGTGNATVSHVNGD